MHYLGLLCKRTYCCCADLAVYTTAVCIDAKTLAFLMRSVVLTACLVSGLVYACSGAKLLGQSYKGCNRLLYVAVLFALAGYVIVYLLLGVYVPNGRSACDSELYSAPLEARDVCDVLVREKAGNKVSIISLDLLLNR
jgi:hypothetical protein